MTLVFENHTDCTDALCGRNAEMLVLSVFVYYQPLLFKWLKMNEGYRVRKSVFDFQLT